MKSGIEKMTSVIPPFPIILGICLREPGGRFCDRRESTAGLGRLPTEVQHLGSARDAGLGGQPTPATHVGEQGQMPISWELWLKK